MPCSPPATRSWLSSRPWSVTTADVPWSDVVVFHMDEYVGAGPDHPAGFQRWIRERIVDHVRPRDAHYLDGLADPRAECDRYGELLARHPLDLCCLGIGENGHLAFNDPPVADFDDPLTVKVVELEPACRAQQVNEGHFATLDEVPTEAVTVTIPALLDAATVLAIVPEARKADPGPSALTGPVSTACPASILRTKPQVDAAPRPGLRRRPRVALSTRRRDALARPVCASSAVTALRPRPGGGPPAVEPRVQGRRPSRRTRPRLHRPRLGPPRRGVVPAPNPILSEPDAGVKDQALLWAGGRWHMLFSDVTDDARLPGGVRWDIAVVHQYRPAPLVVAGALAGPERGDRGGVARHRPQPDRDLRRHLRLGSGRGGRGEPKLYYRTSTNLDSWSAPHPLARSLGPTPTDRMIDPAWPGRATVSSWVQVGYHNAAFRDRLVPFRFSGRSLGIGGAARHHPLRRHGGELRVPLPSGSWHLVATSNTFDQPWLFSLVGNPRDPASWLHWTAGAEMQIPSQAWDSGAGLSSVTYEHANSVFLCDATATDGYVLRHLRRQRRAHRFRRLGSRQDRHRPQHRPHPLADPRLTGRARPTNVPGTGRRPPRTTGGPPRRSRGRSGPRPHRETGRPGGASRIPRPPPWPRTGRLRSRSPPASASERPEPRDPRARAGPASRRGPASHTCSRASGGTAPTTRSSPLTTQAATRSSQAARKRVTVPP
jgi:6-phosphogluconolactonase/glucosamine-6-phosphate isomerase/deaminase